ncbi:hypothetical protein EE612_033303, partial [Oryza sativa]
NLFWYLEGITIQTSSMSLQAFRSCVGKFSITICRELYFTTYYTSAFAPVSPLS